MRKPVWPAVAASLTLAGMGLTAWINHHEYSAYGLWLAALSVVGAYTWLDRRAKRSSEAMARWLIECARYGTTYIQNATDHDITAPRDVPRLLERHARWVATIRAHAAMYLNPADQDDLDMLHSLAPGKWAGMTSDHIRIRGWTAERVRRLRDIARRLQDGQSTLRRHRPY